MAHATSTAAKAGPRHDNLAPRQDERFFVLPLLRTAGTAGICRLHFLHGSGPCNGRVVTQVNRLINTLESEGYIFNHLPGKNRTDHCSKCANRFVHYVLVAEPMEPKKPASKSTVSGWHKEDFKFGSQATPIAHTIQSTAAQQPLFRTLDDVKKFVHEPSAFLRHETGGQE